MLKFFKEWIDFVKSFNKYAWSMVVAALLLWTTTLPFMPYKIIIALMVVFFMYKCLKHGMTKYD